MEELSDILTEATAAIDSEYFKLPIDGGDPVYRERVYCYELYHQMRSLWPHRDVCRYVLNGEVDKTAHPVLEQLGFLGEKPDLLVHGPGHMADNHAVIEVKSSKARPGDIKTDLTKLALFRNRAGYRRAIYLIYGEAADARIVRRIRIAAADLEGCDGIEIWLHPEVHVPARQFCIL
jgi:hypothetical protein